MRQFAVMHHVGHFNVPPSGNEFSVKVLTFKTLWHNLLKTIIQND